MAGAVRFFFAVVAVLSSLVAAFIAVEHRRGRAAMMPLEMFAGKCFAGLNLLTFLLYGAFGAAMLLHYAAEVPGRTLIRRWGEMALAAFGLHGPPVGKPLQEPAR